MGRFVGVGIDHYETHPPLLHAVAEVEDVARRLRPAFTGGTLVEADSAEVDAYLKAVKDSAPAAPLLLLWCGHGQFAGSKLWLQTREEDGRVGVADVIERCVRSGANQLLFVFDTCNAGGGVMDASAVAASLLTDLRPKAEHVWFGVLVSCREPENARDGAFGKAFRRLLERGPRSPDLQRRWTPHDRMIRGDDFGTALLEEWGAPDQRPRFLSEGTPQYMLPNPRWDEGAPEVVVEHLLRAARGGQSADDRSWFTGRRSEVDEVVAWVTAREPGVRVVTGSAGTGKSAIVGRVVSASIPAERARLRARGRLAHADPGERSVAANIHARGLTADRAAEQLDWQLVRAEVLTAGEHRRKAAELVGALQRASEDGAVPPVLVVDGLDEARGEAFTLAADLLVRLAPYATVVVSTRPVRQKDQELLDELRPRAVLDLDDPAVQESGRAALRDYVMARLDGVHAAMDAAAVAARLVATSAPVDHRPFLLARVVTDQLIVEPVDTAAPDWDVADSIETALDADLDDVTAPGFGLPEGVAAAELAAAMLTTLTWAFGSGFPEEEWLAVSSRLTGHELSREHVSWVLDELGRYVVQDGEGGVAVYRVAHQSLADHLRPPYRRTGEQPFDRAAGPVWEALASRYATLLKAGSPATAPSYLWRYAYRHAAAVGLPGLEPLRQLMAVNDALRPDLAYAALEVADVARTWGRRHDALAPTEEAVTVRRALAADTPAFVPDLAGALNNLGIRYSELGRPADALDPTYEAVGTYRALATDNPAYLPDLAGALNNLGIRYSELGRPADALDPTYEAVGTYRALATDNPAYLPDLALALNNLGVRYSELGRRADALDPTYEAVTSYRALAADNPAYLPDLARALNNLGVFYSELGRRADALPPTDEAVTTYRALATDNPAYLPDLALALNNLGVFYSELGRRADALPPTDEAVTTYQALAADNPAFLPDLARALNNLGNRHGELGRRADALGPTEEAVTIRRTLATDNPAYLPDLALALNNLGVRYSELGRRADALPPTDEAVTTYRALATDNPAFLPGLALALNNLGVFYSELGRPTDALEPTEDAVTIRRTLAADNPAFLPDLASALNNLGIRYSELGRLTDALEPTDEAVTTYRALATDNPAFLPDLASALNNLGIRYRELGRPTDALEPTEEAVTIRRTLAADNPAFLPDLASALNNLGIRYSELGRLTDALEPTDEAVTTYRALATDNPAFLPDLASALNNLGIRYSELGRPTDALEPTGEAVTIRRALVADNHAAFLADLAQSLTNLDRRYAELDEGRLADATWEDVLAECNQDMRAMLLYYRSAATDLGDLRAAPWLVESCRTTDRGLLAAARRQARRHRATVASAWDVAWSTAAVETPPAWLTVDPVLLTIAEEWVKTPTYEDERDHLAAYPELLEAAAGTAVEEALLVIEDSATDRYRRLLVDARALGVDAAYRPLLLRILVTEFAAAPPTDQRTLLADRRADLLDDLVRDDLAARAAEEETYAADRALALLDLARADDPALPAAFDALDDPTRFPALLHDVARDRPHALDAVATLALSAATSEPEAGTAAIHLAIARALTGDPDRAAAAARQARMWDPDRIQTWIGELASLGATHPAVLSLIPVLLEKVDDT